MLVCGSLTFFCRELGLRGVDLERVTIGSFLHDIGKPKIPIEILDKSGGLDEVECASMQRHPSFSRDILLAEKGLNPRIIEMAA
jgi:HD-GYP domain-containing protein (c-di-GMP phosphodiesterase class II)